MGIIQGYPDGTFRPAGLVTRAEAAAMMDRASGYFPPASNEVRGKVVSTTGPAIVLKTKSAQKVNVSIGAPYELYLNGIKTPDWRKIEPGDRVDVVKRTEGPNLILDTFDAKLLDAGFVGFKFSVPGDHYSLDSIAEDGDHDVILPNDLTTSGTYVEKIDDRLGAPHWVKYPYRVGVVNAIQGDKATVCTQDDKVITVSTGTLHLGDEVGLRGNRVVKVIRHASEAQSDWIKLLVTHPKSETFASRDTVIGYMVPSRGTVVNGVELSAIEVEPGKNVQVLWKNGDWYDKSSDGGWIKEKYPPKSDFWVADPNFDVLMYRFTTKMSIVSQKGDKVHLMSSRVDQYTMGGTLQREHTTNELWGDLNIGMTKYETHVKEDPSVVHEVIIQDINDPSLVISNQP